MHVVMPWRVSIAIMEPLLERESVKGTGNLWMPTLMGLLLKDGLQKVSFFVSMSEGLNGAVIAIIVISPPVIL